MRNMVIKKFWLKSPKFDYTYIRSSDPKGLFSSFKTVDLLAGQILVANSKNMLKFRKSKICKEKSAVSFFGGSPIIN
jgi:hypothetical protein